MDEPASDRMPDEPPDEEAALQHALDVAFRFLGKRDRTVAETRRRLESAGIEAHVAGAAIDLLVEREYLDDARYAQRFAEDRRSLDGWGAGRIQQRLRSLGVQRELVEVAVTRSPQAELDAALALLRRRMPAGPSDRQERDRALGVLLRRGYEFELACDAVRVHSRERRAA